MALFRPLTMSVRSALARPMTVSRLANPAFFHTTSAKLSSIINIQDSDDFIDRVINNELPVVIDFHASWCGPCKVLGPRLESLIGDHEGKVIMAKVDIDDNADLAIDHGVEAVPTVLAMKNGQITDKFIGMKDPDQLESFVKRLIGE